MEWAEDDLVAFADVVCGYPTPDLAYIGLLIVAGHRHGRGFGRSLHDELLNIVAG